MVTKKQMEEERDKAKEKVVQDLKQKRADLLYQLCHDNTIYMPEIILGMVNEAKSITGILKIMGVLDD